MKKITVNNILHNNNNDNKIIIRQGFKPASELRHYDVVNLRNLWEPQFAIHTENLDIKKQGFFGI